MTTHLDQALEAIDQMVADHRKGRVLRLREQYLATRERQLELWGIDPELEPQHIRRELAVLVHRHYNRYRRNPWAWDTYAYVRAAYEAEMEDR